MTSIRTRFSKHQSAVDMPDRRRLLLAAAGLTAGAFLLPTRVWAADPLDAPRSIGTVGERHDGYAVARDGATSETQQLVNNINQKRQAFYKSKADEQGVSISAVQEIYAKAIFDKAPSGWWFLTPSGWKQK